MDTAQVHYRLARSMVVLDGRVTTRTDPATLQAKASAQTDVRLGVQAEPDREMMATLRLEREFVKSRDLDVKLTPDGRLASLSSTTAGAGGAVVTGLARIGTYAASVAATLVGALKGAEDELEDAYRADQPEAAQRRTDLRTALGDLQGALAALASRLSEEDLADDERRRLLRSVPGLEATIAAVRAEADALETHFTAWTASRATSSEEAWSTALGTTNLPERPHPDAKAIFTRAELRGMVGRAVDRLGIIPVRIADGDDERFASEGVDTAERSEVLVRVPRPYTLAVYRVDGVPGPEDDIPATLSSVQALWVLDERCKLSRIPLDAGLFSKQTAVLEMSDSGSLSRIASAATSAAQGVADALATVGDIPKTSAGQVQSLVGTLGALQDRASEDRLADLKREKELLEAQIAVKGVAAGRTDREQLVALQAQLDLAKARRTLGAEGAGAELEARSQALRQQLELTKLELELAKVRADAARTAG